jgi:hypothetical protein
LFKATCIAIVLAAGLIPVAVSAQTAAPTPAPATAPTPTPEKFVTVDGTVTGKTYNELAPGLSTGGFGVHAAAELPIIGHDWAFQVDYRSYNYKHSAFGTLPNGITFACPAGDPGCVTPIGYNVYNASFSPGPVNYLNAFNAQDTTTQVSLGSKIAPYERYYISAGYLIRGANYLSYPTESGFGFGLDKLPDVDRAVSVYAGFWVYFNVHGLYTGPSSALLGALSGTTFNLNYRVYAYRAGVTFKIPATRFYVEVTDVGDRADTTGNGPSSAIHNALMLGAGAKI